MSLVENYESSSESESEQENLSPPTKEEKKEEHKLEISKTAEQKTHTFKRKCELPDTDDLFGDECSSVPDFLKKSKEFCPTEKELLILDDRKQPVPPKKPRLNFTDTHGPLEPPREITQREIEKYASAGTRKGAPVVSDDSETTTMASEEREETKDNRKQKTNFKRDRNKNSISEKEKRKLGKKQNEWRSNSSNGYWKTDEEMKLRQQYD